MGRVAAIDFGLKRIGIAVSDRMRKIAFPVDVVPAGKKALQNIKAALPLAEVDLIIVGCPLEMSGKKGEMAKQAEGFAHSLEEAFHIPVQMIDERLSSKEADVHLSSIEVNGKKKRKKLDMIAAQILLRAFLDQQGSFSV